MQYFLTLDNREPGFDACFESSTFANASEDLEKIERQLNIKSHFEFFSYAAQNSLCPPGYEETETPWFAAQEGIDWLEALIGHIRRRPSSVQQPGKLADEFKLCQDVLRKAKEIGAKWHFEMDI